MLRGLGTASPSGTYSLTLLLRSVDSVSSSDLRPVEWLRPWYTFRRGEPGEDDSGGNREGGRSDLDDVEDVRERVRATCFQDSKALIVGEGNGVISSMAAIWGDEITEPGERDPAVECNAALILGARRGRLAAEALVRSLYSELMDC
jgi:hypothetical protein